MADAPASPSLGGGESGGDLSPRSGSVREQDRFLPIANISRIMKKAVPANGKIAKDAKETVQECVSEFISFITSEASDKCQREKRKTINGDDLLWAMATLGFEEYIEPLKLYLQKYRDLEGDGKGSKGGDGSIKKDGGGFQGGPSTQGEFQMGQQGQFKQGMGYMHTQVNNNEKNKGGDGSVIMDGEFQGSPSAEGELQIGQEGHSEQGMGYMHPQLHNGDHPN